MGHGGVNTFELDLASLKASCSFMGCFDDSYFNDVDATVSDA